MKAATLTKSAVEKYRRKPKRSKKLRNRVSVQASQLRQSLVSKRESLNYVDARRNEKRRSSLTGLYQATNQCTKQPFDGTSPLYPVIRISRMSLLGTSKNNSTVAPSRDENKMAASAVLFRMIDLQNTGKVPAEDAVKFLDEHALLRAEDIKILAAELLKGGVENSTLTESSFAKLLQKLNWNFKADMSTIEKNENKRSIVVESNSSQFGDGKIPQERKTMTNKVKSSTGGGNDTNLNLCSNIPVLNPNNPKRLSWDALILLLLAYTMIITPLRLGFDLPVDMDNSLSDFSIGVDLIFIMDVVVNFFTSYPDPKTGIFVEDRYEIAKRYLCSWFTLDLVSSIPFDLFTQGVNSDLTNTAKTFKTGKLLRLFKLSKIIRIVRAARVSRRLEDKLDLAGRAPFQIFKICSGTAFLSHLFACGWAGMARVEGDRKSFLFVHVLTYTHTNKH